MDFQDTQLFGAIIGGGIGVIGAAAVALITQTFTSSRHKEWLAHERDQGNRNRLTGTLEELMVLVEDQATAVQDLLDFMNDPHGHPFLGNFPENACKVLEERGYRKKLWVANPQTKKAIHAYASGISALLPSVRQNQPLAELGATADLLSTAMQRIAIQTSELNGIAHDSARG